MIRMSLSEFQGVFAPMVPSLLSATNAEEVETGKLSDSVPMERVDSLFQVFHDRKNTAFLHDEGGYNGVFPFQEALS
ncbi:hypothetical protein [Sulfuricella denitrificans]|uniref:hypothetical protein n=1 Tax=Sulfuricella denitrificans TaxID=649841 RepID=UPI0011D2A629|nr:hypothetical protein [Sulfuricella denitrificans]